MNRYLTFSLAVSTTVGTLAIPMRAANKPRAGMQDQKTVWTNDDLERLRALGLISIVGRSATAEDTTATPLPAPYIKAEGLEWYAQRATKLREELERRQAQLFEYRQALEDARSLRKTTGGINLDAGDLDITPEAGIEILQQNVQGTRMKLEELEDLARHHGIPPGTLRGQ
ncbi:MAG TPA: hypothetical protein VNO32_50245 [Candidatus Acidoferrum sp.]|nr:hypothetical protein [Candidatus Acidoferrum sp.]